MKTLKRDLFGEIRVENRGDSRVVVRDCAKAHPLLRGLARRLLAREAAALSLLDHLDGIPAVVSLSRDRLERSFIDGRPLQESRITSPGFYRAAMRLVRRIHTAGVVHNDLAKEPNIVVTPAGRPALIDFQIALYPRERTRLFRVLGREDLRHMLKHKRTYCREHLTEREKRILASPSGATRIWRASVKPAYNFVTRRILGWADREGRGRS